MMIAASRASRSFCSVLKWVAAYVADAQIAWRGR